MASKPDESIFVALIEEIRGVRSDMNRQTEAITNKMESNQVENRAEFKEIREDISEMKTRLAEGSERMKNTRKDLDEVQARCQVHSTTALERKRTEQATPETRKRRLPLWQVIAITSIITYAAPILFNKAISFLNSTFNAPAAQATK